MPSSDNSVCSHNQTSGNGAHEKCFHNMSFLMVVIFHGLHVHLIFLRGINFCGHISKVMF
jgi:hypothetical protein